jgi:hypothetical protein
MAAQSRIRVEFFLDPDFELDGAPSRPAAGEPG